MLYFESLIIVVTTVEKRFNKIGHANTKEKLTFA